MKNICKARRRAAAAAFVLLLLRAGTARAQVWINEVMAQNGTYQNGHAYDWIELYNDGKKAVDLSGWHLSDKAGNPLKWAFPSGGKIRSFTRTSKSPLPGKRCC